MLYEGHYSLAYNGTIQLHQYSWNSFKEAVQKFVKHCLQCQTTNLQTLNYVQLHLAIPQTTNHFISIDSIGQFDITTKEKQFTLNVICSLTHYVIYIDI